MNLPSSTHLILSGYGGQGILYLNRFIAQLSVQNDFTIIGAETRGMSQRGGSVTAQLKINSNHSNPLIVPGTGDVLIALQFDAVVNHIKLLRKQASVFSGEPLPEKLNPVLASHELKCYCLSTQQLHIIKRENFRKNMVMLGLFIATNKLLFSLDSTIKHIKQDTNINSINCNKQSLIFGYESYQELTAIKN